MVDESEFVLFDESNARDFGVVEKEIWKRMQSIAWNRDIIRNDDIFDCRYDHIILHSRVNNRPQGQTFEIQNISQHSILRAIPYNNKIKLRLIVKNYGAYDYSKSKSSDSLFSDIDVSSREKLQGTKSDWDWCWNIFKRLMDRAMKGEGEERCPIHKDFEKKRREVRFGDRSLREVEQENADTREDKMGQIQRRDSQSDNNSD